jgi:hypothetical protein
VKFHEREELQLQFLLLFSEKTMKLYPALVLGITMQSHIVPAHAVSFTYTPIPGDVQEHLKIDGDHVAFTGFNEGFGLYQYFGGALTTVATTATPVPGGDGGNFRGFDSPWIDGQSVVFASPPDQSASLKGIYKSIEGVLSAVVDTNTTMPGTPLKFRYLLYPTISDDVISFVGYDSTLNQQGVYRSEGGGLQVVATLSTLAPGGTQAFTDFYGPPIRDGNSTVFRADVATTTGLFRETHGVIEAVFAPLSQVPIANQPGELLVAVAHTSTSEYSADSGNVAFLGASTRANDALFLHSNGIVNVIADTQTVIPDGVGNFTGLSRVTSLDGDHVAFVGFGDNGQIGLYTTLGGSLTKVIDTTDVIDGRGPISGVGITQQALSDNTIGFTVHFADGTRGGYLASLNDSTLSSVEIGGTGGVTQASLLGGTEGGQAGGLDVDFTTAVETAGTFQASYTTPDEALFAASYSGTTGFDLGNFLTTGPGASFQVWDLDFSGTLNDGATVTLQFKYDETGLTPIQEELLGIWHFGEYGSNGARQWRWLRDSIDTSANIITITTDNFSPFAPGFQGVPEVTSLLVWGGLTVAASLARRGRGATA